MTTTNSTPPEYMVGGQYQAALGVFILNADGSYATSTGSSGGTSSTVSVSNFPASQAVTGTFYQATQPVSGTFWQATQPVSNASLPLPAGAATSANQPALNADGGAAAHITNFPATQTVVDTNSAAFQGVVAITPGTATAALRSIGYVITTAGNVTLTLADASTITLTLSVGGFTTLPFAVTNVALGTGTAGSFWNLK